MPIDGQSGGTWIGVNSEGTMAFTTNFYRGHEEGGGSQGSKHSRGEIIPRILRNTDPSEDVLEVIDPLDYLPFQIGVISLEKGILTVWKGDDQPIVEEVNEGWSFFTSSSIEPERIGEWRRNQFDRWREDREDSAEGILEFHFYQDPDHPSESPLVSREKSSTRSITQIDLNVISGEATLRYWSRPQPATEKRIPSPDHTVEMEVHVLRQSPWSRKGKQS